MHLIIAIGSERSRTMDGSGLVRVVFVMHKMLLQWQDWAIFWYSYMQISYVLLKICFKLYTADARFTYAGHRSRYSRERLTCIRLASLCTKLRQSAVYLRWFTNAGRRGLLLSMFKNNLRSLVCSALICGHRRSYKSPTDPVCSLFESYLRQPALLCVFRSADWRRLT